MPTIENRVLTLESLARKYNLRAFKDLKGTTKNINGTDITFSRPTFILPFSSITDIVDYSLFFIESNNQNTSEDPIVIDVYTTDAEGYTLVGDTFLKGRVENGIIHAMVMTREYTHVTKYTWNVVRMYSDEMLQDILDLQESVETLEDGVQVKENRIDILKDIESEHDLKVKDIEAQSVSVASAENIKIGSDDSGILTKDTIREFIVDLLDEMHIRPIIVNSMTKEDYEAEHGEVPNGTLYLQVTENV